MLYVNYMGETLSVADYIVPGVEHSDDLSKLVTVSRFAPGVCPECLPGGQFQWITDRDVVLEQGRFLGEFRRRSQQFAVDEP